MADLVIRQFEVRAIKGRGRKATSIVVLQSHLLDGLDTSLVAPLLGISSPAPNGVIVTVTVGSERRQLILSQIAAVPIRNLGRVEATVLEDEDTIRRGLDRLFSGF